MTAWIALGLSLAAFLWTVGWSLWLYRRSSRPRLIARARLAVTSYPTGNPQQCLSLEATNSGSIPVTLNSVVIEIEGRGETILVTHWLHQHPDLPARLDPGAGVWTGFADLDDLRRHLTDALGPDPSRQVRVNFGIAGGHRFRSPWFTL